MIKAIKKARKNGWKGYSHYNKFEMNGDRVRFISDNKHKLVVGIAYAHINEIIFDIDFARARWGEGCKHEGNNPNNYKRDWIGALEFWICPKCDVRAFWYDFIENKVKTKDAWQYHLQQIALVRDRIAYLNKYE